MHFIKGDIEGIASFILLAVALLTMPVSLIALIYGLRLRTSRRLLSGGLVAFGLILIVPFILMIFTMVI